MMPPLKTRGICLIAYGQKADAARQTCQTSISLICPYPTTVQSATLQEGLTDKQASRLAKVTLYDWSPYTATCYLDADTLVRGDLAPGFQAVESGWDMCATPSPQQAADILWHLTDGDRQLTFDQWGGSRAILQIQAGALWFARNERVARFFACWQTEWLKFKDEDQGAFLRALAQCPIRLWLLGFPFNGGAVVEHHWGRVRSKE